MGCLPSGCRDAGHPGCHAVAGGSGQLAQKTRNIVMTQKVPAFARCGRNGKELSSWRPAQSGTS